MADNKYTPPTVDIVGLPDDSSGGHVDVKPMCAVAIGFAIAAIYVVGVSQFGAIVNVMAAINYGTAVNVTWG